MQISCSCDEDATPHVGWVGIGWGTDNVPVDATQLTALRRSRRGQGTQHVMKMLRHMWVGWGWGGALITFLLMLRNSQLYAATAGDKVCNMWWRCYATCGLGGDGVGWGTDKVPVDATQRTALRSNRRGQGTQHVMKMLRHMWVGWGWGGALITFLLMLHSSQLYAATAGDKARNMWWRCYATCGLGGDGVGHW